MITFFLTIFILLIIIFSMSIGVIFSNKELKGSCGGISEACNCTTIQKKICSIKNTINQ